MTKAEQRALEAYPRDDDKELNFRRANYRIAYERGYNQADKDRALTVEDIKTILDISFWNEDPEKILDEYNRLHQTKA